MDENPYVVESSKSEEEDDEGNNEDAEDEEDDEDDKFNVDTNTSETNMGEASAQEITKGITINSPPILKKHIIFFAISLINSFCK